MWPLISLVLVILGALGLKRLFPVIRNVRSRRRQVRFIRETLANGRRSNDRRVIASLSTVPDRIGNLEPTIRSLLKQTRPPDEIVLAIPEFSVREQRLFVPDTYRGPIFMGDNGRVNVVTNGRLYLSVNDDYLDDNTGEYQVTLSVRR